MSLLAPLIGICLVLALSLVVVADWIARRLLHPPRLPVTGKPGEHGIPYEDIAFLSTDGLSIKGWWIPAPPASTAAPVMVLLHPLFGNRLGSSRRPTSPFLAQSAVDLLALAAAWRQAGYAVLLFDFRGHGESQAGLCGGGLTEDQDVVGAVDWAFARFAGEAPQVGVVGYGLGAAAAVAAVGRFKGGTETYWVFSGDSEGGSDFTKISPPNIKQLAFVIAIDPISSGAELHRGLRRIVGPLSGPLVALVSRLCVWRGGFPLNPAALQRFAAGVTVPVLYGVSDACSEAACQEVRALYEATAAPHRHWWSPADQPGAASGAHFEQLLAFAHETVGSPHADQATRVTAGGA